MEIPTAKEQGFNFVHANMHFWWFPKDTEQSKIDFMADVIRKCMATPQVPLNCLTQLSEPFIETGQSMKDVLKDRIGKIQSVDASSPDVLPNIPLWMSVATAVSFVYWLLSKNRTTDSSGTIKKTEGNDGISGECYRRQGCLWE